MRIASVLSTRGHCVGASRISEQVRGRNDEALVFVGDPIALGADAAFLASLPLPAFDRIVPAEGAQVGARLADALVALESLFLDARTEAVLVFGDTDPALAAALAARKISVPIAHVEAGLRTGRRRDQAEANRVLVDHLADVLLCPTPATAEHLARENVQGDVHVVGDPHYDAALYAAQRARGRDVLERLDLEERGYVLAMVRADGTLASKAALAEIAKGLGASPWPVLLLTNPAIRIAFAGHGMADAFAAATTILDPVTYLDYLALLMGARKVVTDSGSMQREAYFFGVPSVLVGEDTPWMEIVEDGWAHLAGPDGDEIADALRGFNPVGTMAKSFGDGRAAERIAELVEGLA
jgi:UDP-N-acetylglucosamine 2-epimerase